MNERLHKKVCDECHVARENGETFLRFDAVECPRRDDLYEFLAICRAYEAEHREVKVYDYIVCFRGDVLRVYPFLEMLTPMANRYNWPLLQRWIERLRLSILEAMATAKALCGKDCGSTELPN